jgi:hypothetical protein
MNSILVAFTPPCSFTHLKKPTSALPTALYAEAGPEYGTVFPILIVFSAPKAERSTIGAASVAVPLARILRLVSIARTSHLPELFAHPRFGEPSSTVRAIANESLVRKGARI